MSKRQHDGDKTGCQPIKKQENNSQMPRNIRSLSAERTLQLLYAGAERYHEARRNRTEEEKVVCMGCSRQVVSFEKCRYCDRTICIDCKKKCKFCQVEFCTNCVFPSYANNNNEYICFPCYNLF